MYYFFEPLLDSEGKQVVRIPKEGDYFHVEDGDVYYTTDRDHFVLNHPILALQKFDEDPLKEVKELYEIMKEEGTTSLHNPTIRELWDAMVRVMKKVEGK